MTDCYWEEWLKYTDPLREVVLNQLLQKLTVTTAIIGACNEEQCWKTCAVGWAPSAEQRVKLDTASEQTPIYPRTVPSRLADVGPRRLASTGCTNLRG